MVQVAVSPYYIEDATLKIGATDTYEAHCSRIEATESSPVVWRGLTPSSRFKRGAWQLQIDLAQDWETANSLSNYLFDHDGEVVPVEFAPVAGGQTFYAQAVLAPSGIGGAQGSVAVASVTLELTAKPSKIAPGV